MRLTLKNVENSLNERINIFKKEVPCLDAAWHYHAQYELLYVSKSTGIRFVGDSVAQFYPGDLVLVGGYLPHLWRNDPSYYERGAKNEVATVVMKFMKDFLGQGTFENTEFAEINNLLEESKYGICFGKEISETLRDDLIQLPNLSDTSKSIKLLSILNELSLSEDRYVLSSTDMRQFTDVNTDRLDQVVKYISDNYATSITLKDVADIAFMTRNSFCRFFKKMTNKSFTQFLNEVRIRNAARLLVQDQLSVSEVCFKVGYQSITNFYRQFKVITGTTPKEYQRNL